MTESKDVVMPFTRLEGKEFSPLVIRRYSTPILHFVAVISDDNLNELDNVCRACWIDESGNEFRPTGIQDFRNQAGYISEVVYKNFPKSEGIAVIISADKLMISSLFGDFMVHGQCKSELYSLLNMATQV